MTSRLGVLSTLYVTQYLGIGFITVGLVAILRDGGTSLETLAVLQFVGLIWPLKFLWAPVLDRFGARRGHYRSWLLVLQTGLVVSLLTLLPFTDPARHLGPVIAICAAYVLLSATQDVAADAVAVRLLSESRRGIGNGIQVAASYLGTVLGGGACVVVYDRYGWVPAILVLAGLTLAGLVVVARFHEPERTDRLTRVATAYRSLLTVFGQPGCRLWTFVVVPLIYVGAAGAYALVSPAMVDAGWSLAQIGVLTGIVASVPAIVAGLLGGGLIGRLGRTGVLVVAGAGLIGSTVALLPLMKGHAPGLGTTIALCGFLAAYTVANVVLYTVNMDYSRPATGGSDFTVLASFGMICSFIAASVALFAAGAVGYASVAIVSTVLVLAGVVVATSHQRRYGEARRPATEPPVVAIPHPVDAAS